MWGIIDMALSQRIFDDRFPGNHLLRSAAPVDVQRLHGKPSLKMAHVCTRSNAFFSRNSLPRPVVSRSAAYRNRAGPVRASAQNGDLFFVTNNVFKVRSLINQHTFPHNRRATQFNRPCNRSNRRGVSNSRRRGRTASHA
jgi:hypothetical protein